MRLRIILALVLLTVTKLSLRAQNQDYFPYCLPQTVSEKYRFDSKELYNKVSAEKVRGVKQRDINRYAESIGYQKQNMFFSGRIYLDWPEIEEYVNKVYKQILPDSLKNNSNFVAYVVRNPDINAFTVNDGSIYINIGLLAEVENEAALASVLGHELTHYLKNHSKTSYFKGLKAYTKRNRNDNASFLIDHAKFDRKQELYADSLGFVIARNAGYDNYFGLGVFYLFQNEEDFFRETKTSEHRRLKNASRDGDEKSREEILLNDHPETSDRANQLALFIGKIKRDFKYKEYIIDEAAFKKIKWIARHETIALEFDKNDYLKCVQKCFAYHMIDPDNNYYLSYLIEALRRQTYIKPSLLTKSFLTDRAPAKRVKEGQGILHHLNFILRDTMMYADIKNKELSDTSKIEFETYTEAFNYFTGLAQKRQLSEAYLTLALFNSKDFVVRSQYLEKYLAKKNIKHREYAEILLKNGLTSSLEKNKKELILFDEISFLEDHYYGYRQRLMTAEEKSANYEVELKTFLAKKFPNKEVIALYDLKRNNASSCDQHERMLAATTYDISKANYNNKDYVSNQKKVDAFILNPELWDFYKSNQLKSLEYIKTIALDDRTSMTASPLRFVNPLFYFYEFLTLPSRFIGGSNRFSHKVNYYSYDVTYKEPFTYKETVEYKLNKAHFLNTIYYALKSKEKAKDNEE
jgi:hypothetical protein